MATIMKNVTIKQYIFMYKNKQKINSTVFKKSRFYTTGNIFLLNYSGPLPLSVQTHICLLSQL